MTQKNDCMRFTDISCENGVLLTSVEEQLSDNTSKVHRLEIQLPPDCLPQNDLIALAFVTLCGRTCKSIYLDLDLNSEILESLKKCSLADVKCKGLNFVFSRPQGKNAALAFSGGLDSLASLAVMPKNTKLISIDFGGKFSRERNFFQTFAPYTISTNLLETQLHKRSWTFMGIGFILLRDYLDLGYYTFGSIFEAGASNFNFNPSTPPNNHPTFGACGLQPVPYVMGLTEIATTKVAVHYFEERVKDSLISLANPGEDKLYRKHLLLSCIEKKLKKNLNLPTITLPYKAHFLFGGNFAVDFLSLFFIKNLGESCLQPSYRDIPDEIINLAKSLSLQFYERINTNFYTTFPEEQRRHLYDRLLTANILPFTSEDWKEFQVVKNMLAKWHPEIKANNH